MKEIRAFGRIRETLEKDEYSGLREGGIISGMESAKAFFRGKHRGWRIPAALLAGILCVFLFCGPFSLLSPAAASDFDACEDPDPSHYEYEETIGGIEITNYIGPESRLIFPQALNGARVVSIGRKDWDSYKNLEAVIIPEGVQRIEMYAFDVRNIELKSIRIPASVEEIGRAAFPNFSGELILDPGNPVYEKIGNCVIEKETGRLVMYVFDDNADIHLPERVRILGYGAFKRADCLQYVTIPGTVKIIEREAFVNCNNMQTVTILEGVQSIQSDAFDSNFVLAHVRIMGTGISIEGGAFNDFYGKIEFDSDQTKYYVKENCVIEKDTGRLIVYSHDKNDGIHLPEDVRTIGDNVFLYSLFQNVIIPGTVENIERYAFWNGLGLTTLNIQEGVRTIGDYAFGASHYLLQIEIPGSVESIGAGAFELCDQLQTVTIREGVRSIGDIAFANDTALTRIEIPASVEKMGAAVFQGCDPSLVIAAPAGSAAEKYAKDYGFAWEEYTPPAGPMPTIPPAAPEPTATPTPEPPKLTVQAAPEADPSLLDTEVISPEADEDRSLIMMPAGETYTRKPVGVLTFRNDAFRRNAASGTVRGASALSVEWTADLGAGDGAEQSAGGIGWPGQPAIVKWAAEIRALSGLYAEKRDQVSFKEVIAAGLDGTVYFLDLADGTPSRDPIRLEAPLRGTPSLHPGGLPYMSIGQEDSTGSGRTGLRQFNLYTNEELALPDGMEKENSQAFSSLDSFETSALVDRTTDNMITAGSNGLLYVVHLGSEFDYQDGTYAQHPAVTLLKSKAKGENDADTAVEASVAMYDKYVYYADMGGILRCVDTDTMQPVWCADTGDSVASTVALDFSGPDGLDLFTANILNRRAEGDAQVRCYDALSGREKWIAAFGVSKDTVNHTVSGFRASPVVGQNGLSRFVYYTVNNLSEAGREKLGVNEAAALIALDRQNGDTVWAKGLTGTAYSSPVAVYDEAGKGRIIQCCGDGRILLLDGLTGNTVAETAVEGSIEGSPAVYINMMVIGTTGPGENKLYGIRIIE